MVGHLRIFRAETFDGAIILRPEGDGSAFRYNELHMEANSVRGYLMRPGLDNLVIDLSAMQYFGSEFIGALVSMARETRNRGGKVAICSATEQMRDVLKNMSLFKLWPYFETRDEALAYVQEPAAEVR